MTTTTSHQGGDGPAPAGPFICRRSMHYDRGRRLHEALRLYPAGGVRGGLPCGPMGEDRGRLKSNQPSLHETQGGSHGPVGSIHVARVAPIAPRMRVQSRDNPAASMSPQLGAPS